MRDVKLVCEINKEKDFIHNMYINIIPDFIDCKKEEGAILWDIVYGINILMLDLISDYVYSDKKVKEDFIEELDVLINSLSKKCDKLNLLIIIGYFNEILDIIEERCLDMEFYESLENIKKFKNEEV